MKNTLSTFGGLFFLVMIWLAWLESDTPEKINGASLVSPRVIPSDNVLNSLKSTYSNHVAIIPFAFSRSGSDTLIFDHQRMWQGETREGTRQLIEMAQKHKYKIMLKPHVWIRGEGWPGDFQLSDSGWAKWEKDYRRYILAFATLADEYEVEIFCIGTEIRHSVRSRPDFWTDLIREVRDIYQGKITYAANWDNFKCVTFWDQLDFIGVDAYFPIDTASNPSLDKLSDGWQSHKMALFQLHYKYHKPILFTEFGYQSALRSAGNQWEVKSENISMESQTTAYEALFEEFWSEKWIAGGFFWKWHLGGYRHKNSLNSDYTPQQKPAQEIISKYYRASQSR